MIGSSLIVIGMIVTFACPLAQASEEAGPQKQEPKTYEKCVLAASERNTKWTQYRADVNKCRAEFDVPEKY